MSCARWAELGVCKSPNYTLGQKMAYCRRSCKLCSTKSDDDDIGSDEDAGAGSDKNSLQTIIDALKDIKQQLDAKDA